MRGMLLKVKSMELLPMLCNRHIELLIQFRKTEVFRILIYR